MRVAVVVVGAVALTGLIAAYQLSRLEEGARSGSEEAIDAHVLPYVSSTPAGLSTSAPAAAGEAAESLPGAEGNAVSSGDRGASSERSREGAPLADSRRVEQLRASLLDPSSRRRARAAEELGESGDRSSARALRRLARRDPSNFVREAAVEALGELDATGELAEIVSDPDVSEDTKLEAIEEVVDANPELDFDAMTTEALLAALDDPSPDVYEEAAWYLEDVEDPWFIDRLWGLFQQYMQTDYDRSEIVLDLLEYHDQEIDEARELLDYHDPTDWDEIARRRRAEVLDGACVAYAGNSCS